MLQRSTIQLLRFHFSFFLLPVFLFAWSQAPGVHTGKLLLSFVIMHLLVYPSSNGYNSYMDADDTPIGGLQNPSKPTRQLYHTTLLLDAVAIVLSFIISLWFALGILLYIMASRAYSYRKIRLKKYPFAGFLTVMVFQGAWVYALSYHAIGGALYNMALLPLLVSSLLIGALYPLTQVYQHEADAKDGVTTISMFVGKRGTFLLSATLFLAATSLLLIHFWQLKAAAHMIAYLVTMSPVLLFFLNWMYRVWHRGDAANFSNALRMNVLASLCTSLFFSYLILQA